MRESSSVREGHMHMNVAVKWRTRQSAVKGEEGRRWKEAGRRENEAYEGIQPGGRCSEWYK
jgi:hypothetical protein